MPALGMWPAALLLAACSPGAADPQPAASSESASVATHPVSGLEVIPVTIEHEGQTFAIQAEVARSPEEQRKGLMFRTSMGADEGMLFIREEPRIASFWMKNTVMPLDIIYIGTDGRIMNIHENTTPYSEQQYWSDGPAAAVLELNGGRSAELGIGPGAKVTW